MTRKNDSDRYRESSEPERRRNGLWRLEEERSGRDAENLDYARERRAWTDEEIRQAVPIQERLRDNLLREEGFWVAQEPQERDPEEVWKEKERLLFGQAGGRGLLEAGGQQEENRFFHIGRTLRIQLAASILLFAAVWAVFHTNTAKTEPVRQAVREVMTNEWNFKAVSVWYEKRFGTLPSFLPAYHSSGEAATEVGANRAEPYAVPVRGTISSSFTDSTPWIGLATAAGAPVSAMDGGMVTYSGEQTDGGLTLTIRHSGGMESTYAGFAELTLQKGDWVQKGEALGRVSRHEDNGRGQFRFAVMKDGLYVNPVEWVKFD
ncbi:M23 family metallopeptidase [Gorillibacterium timonense]|uniref:M23 family metallopeptidase n=1 Tax=Gorillibacterium timonense TaxID=1689269 RepID=UPI00071DA105|nr:M23 family metallopeptidase [Gorillibacterium timonense]